MLSLNRRDWLTSAAAATISAATSHWSSADETDGPSLRIAPFRADVTPPIGHPLCGGWIKPATVIDDPLEAIGYVIVGADKPIVVCAFDWTGILNSAHLRMREAIAAAVGTTPDRVAVQCVHQHDAPFACLDAQAIVAQYKELPAIVDVAFFDRVCGSVAKAAAEAVTKAVALTHVAIGVATVEKVAGNRRKVGPDGKVHAMRGSSCKDPALIADPEGLIDPLLRTIAFFSSDKKVVSSHYYACHPMSHYGQGRVSADFCGLARKQRQAEDPGCTHIYFTGCAGDIAAGKYNDGSPEMRPVLTRRMYDAIVLAEDVLKPVPIESLSWQTELVQLRPDLARWDAQQLAALIADPAQSVTARNRSAYTLAYLQRCERQQPIVFSALHVNSNSILHLPAECFIEYQLHAQDAFEGRFVCCAAYGDGGPWYLPTRPAFPQGGYEVSVAWCGPPVEDDLKAGIERLIPAR
jgi:hypothetical protein